MDLSFLNNTKNLTAYQLEQKLNSLIRQNYHYGNLGAENKKLILDLIAKYKPAIIAGRGISSIEFRNENYRLYENRLKLKLSEKDLADIKEILSHFKK
ncbi:MAG: hypothetical protein US81_C0001G0016 [Parcubacteria group bacterium GW2011_GWE2_38_18]|nr:MAG: hypothetical protein US81_C0001G0016 [Parcubacteria group bacterium GW2011_GWE2_38_18]